VDTARLAGLTRPESEREAEDWLADVVLALGPRFDPETGFDGYWLDGPVEEQLESDLVQVRRLLGERVRDLAYFAADSWLSDLDGEYRLWARPVTQPSPRLWFVERPGLEGNDRSLDPSRGLAFEDALGIWWIWEPATGRFYNDTPWLFTEFYFGAGARRGVFVKSENSGQQIRFTPVSPAEARRVIEDREVDGAAARFMAIREAHDVRSLGMEEALAAVTGANGSHPSSDP
jgi:hypothetical protein